MDEGKKALYPIGKDISNLEKEGLNAACESLIFEVKEDMVNYEREKKEKSTKKKELEVKEKLRDTVSEVRL